MVLKQFNDIWGVKCQTRWRRC